jgi:hypothetical protein
LEKAASEEKPLQNGDETPHAPPEPPAPKA